MITNRPVRFTISAVAPTRAKDSDREDTCKILDAALADGQLSAEEHRQPSDVTSTYLIVEASDDQTTPGAVSLSAYVCADYGSGYIKFAADGTIERLNPPS